MINNKHEVIKRWKTKSRTDPRLQRSRKTTKTRSPAQVTARMINNNIPNPKRFSSALTPLRYTDGIYTEMDNELARENLENDLPAADRQSVTFKLPNIGDYM